MAPDNERALRGWRSVSWFGWRLAPLAVPRRTAPAKPSVTGSETYQQAFAAVTQRRFDDALRLAQKLDTANPAERAERLVLEAWMDFVDAGLTVPRKSAGRAGVVADPAAGVDVRARLNVSAGAFLVRRVRQELPRVELSLHLHDTRGLGLANMFVGYEEGVRIFDVCAGGLGGCPFVKGAAGNVPAEDAGHMFGAMGVETGVDLEKLSKVVEELEFLLGRSLPGRMTRVLRAESLGA